MSNNNNTNEKDKKIDNLINLVENHTRTQRHLEQYSNIGNREYKEMAENKQKVRENQIDILKEQLSNNNTDKLTIDEQINNIAENYTRTEEYLQNNFNNMPKLDINNIEEKQKNRIEQINSLSSKNNNNLF